MATNKALLWHLKDHDYILTTKSYSHQIKTKKQLKITELKAVYNCKLCGLKTMDRNVMHKHICQDVPIQRTQINTDPPPGFKRCLKCNPSTAETKEYACSKCSYVTKKATSLKVHMHIHARGTPYKCSECDYAGNDLRDLIKHYNEVKNLECKCGYATHVKQRMVSHMRSHSGEKPFSCGMCAFSTGVRGSLARHVSVKHRLNV